MDLLRERDELAAPHCEQRTSAGQARQALTGATPRWNDSWGGFPGAAPAPGIAAADVLAESDKSARSSKNFSSLPICAPIVALASPWKSRSGRPCPAAHRPPDTLATAGRIRIGILPVAMFFPHHPVAHEAVEREQRNVAGRFFSKKKVPDPGKAIATTSPQAACATLPFHRAQAPARPASCR